MLAGITAVKRKWCNYGFIAGPKLQRLHEECTESPPTLQKLSYHLPGTTWDTPRGVFSPSNFEAGILHYINHWFKDRTCKEGATFSKSRTSPGTCSKYNPILFLTVEQGCPTHFHRVPCQPRSCLQRTKCNFRIVKTLTTPAFIVLKLHSAPKGNHKWNPSENEFNASAVEHWFPIRHILSQIWSPRLMRSHASLLSFLRTTFLWSHQMQNKSQDV